MRKKIFQWLGREFVELSCEGKTGPTATEETQLLFPRFEEELRETGLSLENTVRTRLWARDSESRSMASNVRFKVLSGKARSGSSSYIAPGHFDSEARVALDLLAMRPSQREREKILVEYDPPIVPLRYLTYDSNVFLSGVTVVLPTLADQLSDIVARITGSLANAGVSWEQVVKVSCFLHRTQKIETFKALFTKNVQAEIPQLEFALVDGYSSEGKLVEVEVTAKIH